MGDHSSLQPFDLNYPELWDSWVDGFTYHLTFHKIVDNTMKKVLHISTCGTRTLDLAKNQILPRKLAKATSDDILKALANHFTSQPSLLACRVDFQGQIQQSSSSFCAASEMAY